MKNDHHPLSPAVLISGLIVTILGGVIVAILVGEGRFSSPSANPNQMSTSILPTLAAPTVIVVVQTATSSAQNAVPTATNPQETDIPFLTNTSLPLPTNTFIVSPEVIVEQPTPIPTSIPPTPIPSPIPTAILPTPTLPPTDTAIPPTPVNTMPICPDKEIVIVHSASGVGVETQYSYVGIISVTIFGTIQSSGLETSDAFYVFRDGDGNNIEPPRHPDDWILTINGQLAHSFVSYQGVPPYSDNHIYSFYTIPLNGKLIFGVDDGYWPDNIGDYTVELCQP